MTHPQSISYNMDCLEYMRSLPDKHFDLCIADPPYGLDKKSTHGRGKLKNRCLNRGNIQKWDVRPDQTYFDEIFRISKNQIIWGGNYFPLPPTRCFVCWDKQQVWENFSQCELAWTSFNKPAKHVTISNRGKHIDHVNWHPTSKPVELYTYLLSHFAQQCDNLAGVKTEEYRKIKPYWCKRIAYCRNNLCWFRDENNECVFRDSLININRLNYTHVKFSYGYTKRTMTFGIEVLQSAKASLNGAHRKKMCL